jgi:hypothetical protein
VIRERIMEVARDNIDKAKGVWHDITTEDGTEEEDEKPAEEQTTTQIAMMNQGGYTDMTGEPAPYTKDGALHTHARLRSEALKKARFSQRI